jgi:hypothetical protein
MTVRLPGQKVILGEERLAGDQDAILEQKTDDPYIRTRQWLVRKYHRTVAKACATARIRMGGLRRRFVCARCRTAWICPRMIAYIVTSHTGHRACQAGKRAGQEDADQNVNGG